MGNHSRVYINSLEQNERHSTPSLIHPTCNGPPSQDDLADDWGWLDWLGIPFP